MYVFSTYFLVLRMPFDSKGTVSATGNSHELLGFDPDDVISKEPSGGHVVGRDMIEFVLR